MGKSGKKAAVKSSPKKSKNNDSWGIRILKFFFKVVMWFFILSIGSVLIYRFVPVFYTPLMFIRMAEQHKEGKEIKLERDWVSIDEISGNMPLAVMASEDCKFLEHNGFDVEGILKAYEYNQKKKNAKKRRIHGGSTISQQTAKNVFLYPSRSYVRKGLEAYFTVLIEFCWSKERIMEVYLNVIEMGDGIYGVEAASQEYFHKSAKKLTKSQAALIAVCLPNPRKFNPAHPSGYIIGRKGKILREMNYLRKTTEPITSE